MENTIESGEQAETITARRIDLFNNRSVTLARLPDGVAAIRFENDGGVVTNLALSHEAFVALVQLALSDGAIWKII